MNIYAPYNQSDFDRVLESVTRKYGAVSSVEKRMCTEVDLVYSGGATSKIFFGAGSMNIFNPSGAAVLFRPYMMNGFSGTTSIAAGVQMIAVSFFGQLFKGHTSTVLKTQIFCWIFNLENPIP